MRIPTSVFTIGRYALALAVVTGSVVLMSAPKKTAFTPHDKAYYASEATVNFVRPGLTMKIVSTDIAQNGTITLRYKITDPKGLPLDRDGITTPGAVAVSFICAYIPKGQTQFVAYTTRVQTSPITKVSATQAGSDAGGTTKQVADGEYTYTFSTKAAGPGGAAWDPSLTHRAGIYGSRNLTEFDLGTDRDDDTMTWVPAGGAATNTRDVIRTPTCNKCHDALAAHGGTRRSMELCIMCHTPQTIDPDTGNTVDMPVMTHKIHMGDRLPSVIAGTPYQIIGNGQSLHDYSSVAMPSNVQRCEFCHEPTKTAGAAQADHWLTNPNRAACGACHDDVNFATGKNHVNLPQVSDNQCSQCHIPQGELEFDASIKGAHTVATESTTRPGLVLSISKVDNGVAGKAPTVSFTVRDYKGNGISMAQMTGGLNRLGLVLAGPTMDYGYTSFGSDVTSSGYVSENPVPTAKCAGDGSCTYTFTHVIPAKATGTYSIGIEGRRELTLLPGTTQQLVTEYGAVNKVFNFSVDGSRLATRRQVVDIAKCNGCHSNLSLHGENRNQIEQCVLCHNPSENDGVRRAVAVNPADKAQPNQSVNFALMIHKIHTGEGLTAAGQSYTIVGFGGSHNDFSEVRYPAMTLSGSTANTAKCYMCHVSNSEANFPIGKNNVLDPQGRISPVAATTSACTGCHLSLSALSHS
ncbi:MAG: OmcA/MtrC family decaheme c-type cytochrome, partial [Candidatus Solibacter sp.]|nr:OmcA/MtrC family decaheme c-type cytochrome [Candidatus Solibacter sp.]